jgi:hypothetical protein
VWRDHLLAEEARLNARLAELDATPPGELDVRIDEAKDEVSGRLAEVHASLAEMEAESGPARAAALLAGETPRLQCRHRSLNCEQVSDLASRIKAGQQGPSPVVGGARNSPLSS